MGIPSARTVYIEFFDPPGPIFFANTKSGKGIQLKANPLVALCFYWPSINLQILVDGKVDTLSPDESDKYWNSRSRESQIGAWASEQSLPSENSDELKERVLSTKKQFSFERIPRPDHWLAFQVAPSRLEFWQAGWGRLRARTKYYKDEHGQWQVVEVNP